MNLYLLTACILGALVLVQWVGAARPREEGKIYRGLLEPHEWIEEEQRELLKTKKWIKQERLELLKKKAQIEKERLELLKTKKPLAPNRGGNYNKRTNL